MCVYVWVCVWVCVCVCVCVIIHELIHIEFSYFCTFDAMNAINNICSKY